MCSSPTFEVFTSLSYTDNRQTLEIVVIPKFSFRYLTLFFTSRIVSFVQFSSYKSLPTSMRFGMVGTSGLEPPTSRLSGVRSNHLSYAPMDFKWLPHSFPCGFRHGGDEEDRTPDPLLAKQVLYQLSYTPALLKGGGPKWTRTTDLTLIRRAL